jgi:hypothetical protein
VGPVYEQLAFAGGAEPRVPEVRIDGGPVMLVFVDGLVYDGGSQPWPVPEPLKVIDALLDALHDPSAHVEARPSEDLIVKIAPGMSAALPAGVTITVDAETSGPPDHPVLRRSFVVSVGGAGLSIRLPGSRWLKVLASIAIRRASLAPNGVVELHGHASGGLDGAVGAGLRHASHHLSDLVKRSPQFARVRTFLDAQGSPARGLPRKVPGDG